MRNIYVLIILAGVITLLFLDVSANTKIIILTILFLVVVREVAKWVTASFNIHQAQHDKLKNELCQQKAIIEELKQLTRNLHHLNEIHYPPQTDEYDIMAGYIPEYVEHPYIRELALKIKDDLDAVLIKLNSP